MTISGKEKIAGLIGAAIGFAALGVGLEVDARDLLINLLAGITTGVGGVFLAVFVVDRLLEDVRQRRWSLVSAQTTSALTWAAIQAGYSLYLRLPAPRPTLADPYTLSLAGTADLVGAFSALSESIRGLTDGELTDGSNLYPGEVDDAFGLIRESVMPKLLALGDAELVAAVADAEACYEELRHSVFLAARFGGDHIANAAAGLCDALGRATAAQG